MVITANIQRFKLKKEQTFSRIKNFMNKIINSKLKARSWL